MRQFVCAYKLIDDVEQIYPEITANGTAFNGSHGDEWAQSGFFILF